MKKKQLPSSQKKKINEKFSINLSHKDIKKIRKLLFMGIFLKVKKKGSLYKVWIYGFQHHFAKARTPVSAFRKIFKMLKEKGVYL